nr:hypothetical protein GCM10020092_074550 [Actinoplanes digitatis]
MIRNTLEHLHAVGRMHQIGIINLLRPDRLLRAAVNNARLGPQAALIMKAAAEHPDAPAVTDERGTLTYRQLDEQSNALAHALNGLGLPERSVVGVLARDHRGLLLAISATARARLRLALMNTGLAKQQLIEVSAREKVQVVLYDEEFADVVDGLPDTITRYVTWGSASGTPIDELIAAHPATPLPLPSQPGGFIILTSGTTGLPKGAPRTKVSPLASALIADRIPFPRQGAAVIASPLFHSTGFGAWTVGLSLANHAVLMRRFDAERILQLIAEHRAEMLVAVPTMLTRILSLGPEVIGKYDTTSLRTVFVAGSPLAPRADHPFPGHLRRRRAQRVRLDGGRRRLGRHARRVAARARHRRPPAGHRPRGTLRRRGPPHHRARRDRPGLRPHRHTLRGLHRRPAQTGHRRPHGHRRPRPPRRRGPALHRRPRRRHDHLRRRERVPPWRSRTSSPSARTWSRPP